MNHSYVDNLSKSAREEMDALAQKMEAIAAADRVREPELTDEEKAEVAACETVLKKSKPTSARLLDQLIAKQNRLEQLKRDSDEMLKSGGDVDKLASEMALLGYAVTLLDHAYNVNNSDITVNESQIRRIKEAARKREIRQEAAKEGNE